MLKLIFAMPGLPHLGRHVPGKLGGKRRGQDGAEHRDADRRADLAEELAAAGGRADLPGIDGVLHGEGEDGQRGTQADAEDDHPPRDLPPRGHLDVEPQHEE